MDCQLVTTTFHFCQQYQISKGKPAVITSHQTLSYHNDHSSYHIISYHLNLPWHPIHSSEAPHNTYLSSTTKIDKSQNAVLKSNAY